MGGAEDELKQGYGDDVSRWKGVGFEPDWDEKDIIVWIKAGRVVRVNWCDKGLKGSLPSEIKELDALRDLDLSDNKISDIPSEIGTLTLLTELNLRRNHLTDLPRELGNLRFLTELNIDHNRLSVLPSTLANLTCIVYLSLDINNFRIVPSEDIWENGNKEQIQAFLATLKEADHN